MRRLLCRFADAAMVKEADRLRADLKAVQADLDEATSKLRIQQVEIDELSAVCARNITRVKAETSAAARRIAEDEHRGEPPQ